MWALTNPYATVRVTVKGESRKWHPTPIFLPGKFYGQRSLVGYSPWVCKESDTSEQPTYPAHGSQEDRVGKMGVKEGPPEAWVLEIAGLAFAGMTQKGTWVEEAGQAKAWGGLPWWSGG